MANWSIVTTSKDALANVGQSITKQSTSTIVPSSGTPVVLFEENLARQFFSIQNNSTSDLYVIKGDGIPSPSNYWLKMAGGSYYESFFPVFQGKISASWFSVNGEAAATEDF